MHVLIVVENSWVPVDRRVWYEATTLRDAGWKVTVICPFPNGVPDSTQAPAEFGSPEYLQGITVYRFPLVFAERGIKAYLEEYFTALVSVARLAWMVWSRERFDILHICNPPDIFFPIGLFYRILGAKFVFDHHDLFPENVKWRYSGFAGKTLYILARFMEFATQHCANTVIVTNQSYLENARQRNGIHPDKLVVVRNGPKSDEFVPGQPINDLKKGFRYMACFVGLMGNEDGIKELVEIIRYTVQELGRKDVFFLVVGDGPERAPAIERLRSLGLTDYVEFTGLIRDDVLLRQYMSTADLFLSPEPWTPMNEKSTFIKIGEYMIMGKPIVAFDLFETCNTAMGAAQYIRSGDTLGFSRALLELLDDAPKRESMGIYGRQRVLDELSWEHQKQRLIQVYNSLSHGKG